MCTISKNYAETFCKFTYSNIHDVEIAIFKCALLNIPLSSFFFFFCKTTKRQTIIIPLPSHHYNPLAVSTPSNFISVHRSPISMPSHYQDISPSRSIMYLPFHLCLVLPWNRTLPPYNLKSPAANRITEKINGTITRAIKRTKKKGGREKEKAEEERKTNKERRQKKKGRKSRKKSTCDVSRACIGSIEKANWISSNHGDCVTWRTTAVSVCRPRETRACVLCVEQKRVRVSQLGRVWVCVSRPRRRRAPGGRGGTMCRCIVHCAFYRRIMASRRFVTTYVIKPY